MFNFIHNYGYEWYPFPFGFERKHSVRLQKEIEFLVSAPYTWWHINPIRLQQYAEIISQRPEISFSNLEVIESNGAFLSEEEKKRYRELFQCNISDNYGCKEIWTIAYSNPQGRMIVNNDIIKFQLVDDDNQIITEKNKVGTVVVTSLFQKVMPFIRYKLGDQAYYVDDLHENGDSPCIKICPSRVMIYGTQMMGNDFFRNVIMKLSYSYGITKFERINIIQREEKKFQVNVKGNQEDKERFEMTFRKCANNILEMKDYEYVFSYNDNQECKSLFVVSLQ